MKFNDAVWGVLLLLLGGALFAHVQGFPSIPGQRYGPAMFPGLIAVGLAICGALLIFRGLRARLAGGSEAAWLTAPEWARSPRHVAGFVVLVAINLLYLGAVDKLGFVVTGTIYLAALMAVLKVKPARVLPLALLLTLAIHFCFYKLLRVPLPWGVLQSVAW